MAMAKWMRVTKAVGWECWVRGRITTEDFPDLIFTILDAGLVLPSMAFYTNKRETLLPSICKFENKIVFWMCALLNCFRRWMVNQRLKAFCGMNNLERGKRIGGWEHYTRVCAIWPRGTFVGRE